MPHMVLEDSVLLGSTCPHLGSCLAVLTPKLERACPFCGDQLLRVKPLLAEDWWLHLRLQ